MNLVGHMVKEAMVSPLVKNFMDHCKHVGFYVAQIDQIIESLSRGYNLIYIFNRQLQMLC
jgi:hypothetical protein